MNQGLALVGARVAYGPIEVLHGVTLEAPAGSLVAVLGRNGAGKSTALRALAGTVGLRSGTVDWDGRDVTRWSPSARAMAGLTLVPDEYGTFGSLTVRENLSLFAGDRDPSPAFAVFPALEPLLERIVRTLSGGEQQMVALSRALLRPGRAVLLDEASRGLAAGAVEQLYAALRQLVTPHRCVVVVEQYVREVLDVADLVYVLRRGEVVFAGEPAELRDDAAVARAMG